MSDSSPSIYRARDLNLFVGSRFLSTFAIQVQSVAIGWQIYDMERTPLALGLVGLCQFPPMFLLTLPAGDITDRFNQRRVYSLAAMLQATLQRAVSAAVDLFASTPPGPLSGAGAVRRGARLRRAVRLLAAAFPGAAGEAGQLHGVQFVLLHRAR